MDNKLLKYGKLVIILLIIQLLFTCCTSDDAVKKQPSQNNTISPSENTCVTEFRQISKQNTKISFTVSRENTFRGCVEAVPEDLPVSELADILLSAGIDPSTPGQDFLSDPLGRFYYSVDLSYAEPLCYTSSHELVCKLKNDSLPSLLIVLDGPTPKKARYYLAPTWDISDQDYSVLLNGEPPTDEEEAFCRKLFHIHALGTGYQETIILDGDVERSEITIAPEPFLGLTYTFVAKAYKGYEACVVYSIQDGCMVFAE